MRLPAPRASQGDLTAASPNGSRHALTMLERSVAAPLAARAAWSLSQWDEMDSYVDKIPPNSIDGSLFRAVLAVHFKELSWAQIHVERAANMLGKSSTTWQAPRTTVRIARLFDCSSLRRSRRAAIQTDAPGMRTAHSCLRVEPRRRLCAESAPHARLPDAHASHVEPAVEQLPPESRGLHSSAHDALACGTAPERSPRLDGFRAALPAIWIVWRYR